MPTCRDGKAPCIYCGLPVLAASPQPAEDTYCCYGCRFAHSIVRENQAEGEIRWTVVKLGLSIFFTMNLMAFTMTMWSLDVYDVKPDPFQQTLFEVFRWLSMVLAFPVLILLGLPIIRNGLDSLRQRQSSTDLLVGVAVLAAYLTSLVNVLRGEGSVYFEVGASVLVMMTLGRWIEATGKHKATETLDQLLTLLPDKVTRVTAVRNGFDEEPIPSALIRKDDLLRIRAGERFPTDGIIFRGSTTVDEQVFSGESTPEPRSTGDSVLAGTVNLDGDVVIQAEAEFRQGSFGRLLRLMQDARTARGYYQRMTEKIAAWFFPVVTAVAFAAFIWHYPAGIGQAIQTTMSVLLIACPCALGLATPLAVWTALSTAVRHQVLFRSGEAIERLAEATTVCFDKTGTLTTGAPQVSQMADFGQGDVSDFLALAAHLSFASHHPFSLAVHQYIGIRSPETLSRSDLTGSITNLVTVPGGGIQGTTDTGTLIRLGSPEFACCEFHRPDQGSAGIAPPELCVGCRDSLPLNLRLQLDRFRMSADHNAASIVLLSVDRIPRLGFLVSETMRAEACTAIDMLSRLGCSLHVLSGDRPAKAKFLERQLQGKGPDDPTVNADVRIACGLTPSAKVRYIEELKRSRDRIVMVGDGINDAPALAMSDVGIAMGCGADVSRDSAQVCLLGNDLTRIPWAIRLARRTRTVIRQNLIWAFGYNSAGIVVAACGFLNPAIAAGLMIVSSLLVISNSLRLLADSPEIPETRTFPANGDDSPGTLSRPSPVATQSESLAALGTPNAPEHLTFDQRDKDEVPA